MIALIAATWLQRRGSEQEAAMMSTMLTRAITALGALLVLLAVNHSIRAMNKSSALASRSTSRSPRSILAC